MAKGIRPGPQKGWKVTVVVDQTTCGDRCRPALRKFAQDYGIALEDVVAHYPERVSGDPVTPKTASKTAHYEPTRISGEGERVLVGGDYPFLLEAPKGARPPAGATPPTGSTPPPAPSEGAPPTGTSAPPAESPATGATASELATEASAAEASARRWRATTSLLSAGVHVWNAYGMIMEVAHARDLALAIFEHGTPFYEPIEQSIATAKRAKEVQHYYNGLDLHKAMPMEGQTPPGWHPATYLMEVQRSFVCIDHSLHEAADAAKSATKDLVKQMDKIEAQMKEYESALVMTMTSTPFAEAYLFAEAGGRVNANLTEAIESYLDALKAIEFQRRMAWGAAKVLEIYIRKQGPDMWGEFPFIAPEDLHKTELSEFTWEGARRPHCS